MEKINNMIIAYNILKSLNEMFLTLDKASPFRAGSLKITVYTFNLVESYDSEISLHRVKLVRRYNSNKPQYIHNNRKCVCLYIA